MRPIIECPILNPIHFVPDTSPADDRSRQYWQDWYYNRLTDGQDRKLFRQPVQFDQKIYLMFHVSIAANVKLELYDCHGTRLNVWNPVLVLNISGNKEPYTGNNLQLYTHYFKFLFSDVAGLQEGTYFLSLVATDGADVTRMDSEPVSLQTYHPHTFLLEYKNETNDYNVIFEQTNCRFAMRLPGKIGFVTPDFEYTSYKNQKNKVTKLYAQPGSTLKMILDGVPDYLHVKANAAICCDILRFRSGATDEAVGFVVDEGAKWDQNLVDRSGLRGAELTIREADPDRSTFIVQAGTLKVAALPDAYPYAIATMYIGELAANLNLLPDPRVIHNDTERLALLTYLNGQRSALDLEGVYVYEATLFGGFNLNYANSANERYVISSSQVITNYFTLFSIVSVLGGLTQFQFTQGLLIVDWGDGSVEYLLAGSLTMTASHSLPTGPHTITIFGNCTQFVVDTPQNSRFIQSIGGKLPATLTALSLAGTQITAFDAVILSNCANVLQYLIFRDGLLANIYNLNLYQFFRLTFIHFGSNKLTSGYVGGIIKVVLDNVAPINLRSGYLALNGQQPAAPITYAVQQTYKVPLVSNYGWGVSND